jgi:3-deoxy-D-arabino-heptulosonate 7-phosphate (DAHP) synthase class II
VPIVHAERAAQRIATARLCAFQFAGHILWLGADAKAMHKARLHFLRGSDLVYG